MHTVLHTSDQHVLLEMIREVTAEYVAVMGNFKEPMMNEVPFPESWTAGQVVQHIIKSNRSVAQVLEMPGSIPGRDPLERVDELKQVFLNFVTKLQAPSFILPEQMPYDTPALEEALAFSVKQLCKAAGEERLSEAIRHPAFGDITKFELLYFILFHMQRHLHQLKKILVIFETRMMDA